MDGSIDFHRLVLYYVYDNTQNLRDDITHFKNIRLWRMEMLLLVGSTDSLYHRNHSDGHCVFHRLYAEAKEALTRPMPKATGVTAV